MFTGSILGNLFFAAFDRKSCAKLQ